LTVDYGLWTKKLPLPTPLPKSAEKNISKKLFLEWVIKPKFMPWFQDIAEITLNEKHGRPG